jgi:nucleoside-diphosphate-sugar epimerase
VPPSCLHLEAPNAVAAVDTDSGTLQGTVNLLTSVAKAGKTVKRVVLTSSVAAMTPLTMANGKGPLCVCHAWLSITESSYCLASGCMVLAHAVRMAGR